MNKFLRKSRTAKKGKLKKARENLKKMLGKFYFKFDKISSKICKTLEQIFKKNEIFVNGYTRHYIKWRQKKVLIINFLRKIIWVSKKNSSLQENL